MPKNKDSSPTDGHNSPRRTRRGRPPKKGKIHSHKFDEKADSLLWDRLRNLNFKGLRFKHNFLLDHYRTNFLCHSERLAIEVRDTREMKEKELPRWDTKEIGSLELRILRFSNKEVLNEIDKVEEIIRDAIE